MRLDPQLFSVPTQLSGGLRSYLRGQLLGLPSAEVIFCIGVLPRSADIYGYATEVAEIRCITGVVAHFRY